MTRTASLRDQSASSPAPGNPPQTGRQVSAITRPGTSAPFAYYGIYAANARRPGSIVHTYASNQGDSAYYVGACPSGRAVLSDAHAERSALGFSGTNSGGHLIIENSLFDYNKSGLTANSQNNDDAPSPQSGACQSGRAGPLGNANVVSGSVRPNDHLLALIADGRWLWWRL